MHVFKTAFLGQENVRLVLIILIRRWKFVLAFLDFYLFFYDFFSSAEYYLKKNPERADWAEAQPTAQLPARPRRESSPT